MNDAPQGGRLPPAEIARRAFKALAERKLIPTPDTFSEVYFEIAGGRSAAASSQGVIKDLLRDLVRNNRLTSAEATSVVELAGRYEWMAVREAVDRALARRAGAAAGNWPHAALALIKQIDALHGSWTRGRKIEAVSRVIDVAADQPDVALDRLQRLIESWGPNMAPLARSEDAATTTAITAAPPFALPVVPPPAASPGAPAVAAKTAMPAPAAAIAEGARAAAPRFGAEFKRDTQAAEARTEADAWKQVALRSMRLLEQTCGESTSARTKLSEYAAQQATPLTAEDIARLVPRFTDAAAVIERQIAEERKVRIGLQRLLGLLCDNMKTLTPDEAWLAGQLEPIRALLSGPLDSAQLSQAELQLAAVIAHQAGARSSLQEAKVALKEILATLIERLGGVGDSTGRFYEQVDDYQKQLERATDFGTLSRVVQGLLAETSLVRQDVQKSRDELLAARRKVEAYERRVRALELELTQVSTLVQKDPLTHLLNRRGLEDAFRIETARAARYVAPLVFMMLDVDNFKRVNDSYGYIAGDRALVHLAQVMHATMRPTDLIGRLGGEEFAVLFQATDIDEAIQATERLQRELARRPLAYERQSIPITFSAGAVLWRTGESLEDLIRRADEALYGAKRAGKNRVEKAP